MNTGHRAASPHEKHSAWRYGISLLVLIAFTLESVLGYAGASFPSNGAPYGADADLSRALDVAFGHPLLDPETVQDFPFSIHIEPTDPVLDQDPFFLRAQSWQRASFSASPPAASPASVSEDAPFFEKTDAGVRVSLPGMAKAWSLEAPLDPLLATDEFLFFTARDARMLAGKTPESEKDPEKDIELGGGVFIVSQEDLMSAYARSAPVPVFFMPLLGDGWEFGVRAYEEPAIQAIHFVDAGDEIVSIKEKDIQDIVAVERKNLEAAQAEAALAKIKELRRDGQFARAVREASARSKEAILSLVSKAGKGAALSSKESRELEEVFLGIAQSVGDEFLYPGRGATAGFGILFTGYDLDRGGASALVAQKSGVWRNLARWLSPKSALANDDTEDPSNLTRQGYASLHRMLAIFGFLFVFAVVTRCAVPSVRKRLQQVSDARDERDMEEALAKAHRRAEKIARKKAKKTGESYVAPSEADIHSLVKFRDSDGFWQKYVVREKRAILNNFTYALTSLQQIARQTTFSVAGTFMDRYLTRYAAAPNRLLRTLFNGTVVHGAKTSSGLPVNDRMQMRAIVIAGIDTSIYAWQLYDWAPGIGRAMGDLVAGVFPGAPQAIEHALQDPHIDINRNYEILKTAQDGVSGGAIGMLAGTRDFYTQMHLGRVRTEMVREGVDPYDSRNAVEFRRRLDEAVDREQHALGFPGRGEFGWDLVSIFAQIKSFVGYEAPEKFRHVENPEGDPEEKIERLLFGKLRPGLVYPALKEALKHSQEVLRQDPDHPFAREGVALFSSLLQDFGILRSIVSAGFKAATFRGDFIQNATRFRRVRQALILLTAAGEDMGPLLEVVGDWKSRISEESAIWAAQVYSSKFIEAMTGKSVRMLPTVEERERFGAEAEASARKDMEILFAGEHAGGVDLTVAHKGSFEQFKEQHVLEMARKAEADEKAKSAAFEHDKLGWFGRWQKRKILKRAQLKFLRGRGHAYDAEAMAGLPDGEKAELRKEWHRIYGEEYARGAGLSPDFAMNPALQANAVREAEFLSTSQEHADGPYRRELESLLRQGRYAEHEDLRATRYAQNFVHAYEDLTENMPPKKVSALDPSRPGWTQPFRKLKWVRHKNPVSRALTVTCRGLLELGTYPTNRLGLNALLDRWAPGFYQFKLAMMGELRSLPVKAGPEYWMQNTLWNNPLNREFWILNRLTMGWSYRMGCQVAYRFFSNIGVQPIGGFRKTVAFAAVWALTTFWGSVLQQPITEWWDKSAWKKMSSWWNLAMFPARWGGRMLKCRVFGGDCVDRADRAEAPPPKNDADQVHDIVRNPKTSDGDDTRGLDRMWDEDPRDSQEWIRKKLDAWSPAFNGDAGVAPANY